MDLLLTDCLIDYCSIEEERRKIREPWSLEGNSEEEQLIHKCKTKNKYENIRNESSRVASCVVNLCVLQNSLGQRTR